MPKFRAISKRLSEQSGPIPPGQFSFGTSWWGGPQFTDPFKSRKAPSPWQLVENYNSLVYAMVGRNQDAISRIPIRLFADGSRAQGGKPRSACDPIRVQRRIGIRLAKAGMVSESAVDQVYEIRQHGILNALDRPDPYGYFDRQRLIGLLVAYGDVVGHCPIVPEGNGWDWRNPGKRKGPPEYLWMIYPQYVIPIRQAGSPLIDFFQYFGDRLPFMETMWFRGRYSLRDAYASSFSPTYAGETYRMQEQEQIQILSQVLGLGPRPNVLISPKDATGGFVKSEDIRKRYEQDLYRRHAGGNAGGVLVVNDAVDVTPLSYSPADMGGKEFAEYAVYVLAPIFGQPPTYYTVDSNLANLEAADAQYARNGIEPRCRAIEQTLNWLVQTWDPRLFFKFDPALPEDDEARQKVIDMQIRSGMITINQANEESKWPPFPEGDEHWIDGSLKTMKQAIEEHEMAKEAQTANLEAQAAKTDNETAATEFQYGEGADVDADVEAARSLLRSMSTDKLMALHESLCA